MKTIHKKTINTFLEKCLQSFLVLCIVKPQCSVHCVLRPRCTVRCVFRPRCTVNSVLRPRRTVHRSVLWGRAIWPLHFVVALSHCSRKTFPLIFLIFFIGIRRELSNYELLKVMFKGSSHIKASVIEICFPIISVLWPQSSHNMADYFALLTYFPNVSWNPGLWSQ